MIFMRVHKANELAKYFSLGYSGYILNFTNAQWDAFTQDIIGIELQTVLGGSKGKSFESFLISNDYSDALKFKLIVELDNAMKDYEETQKYSQKEQYVEYPKSPLVKRTLEQARAYSEKESFSDLSFSFSIDITLDYIKTLPKRIEKDLQSENYDSVITKSNTLIDEVMKYIIEQNSNEQNVKNIDSKRLRNIVFTELNMKVNNDSDKRVKQLVSSLNKMADAVLEMRNWQSDAHAHGTNRIKVNKAEAILMANSAMTFCEYIFSVFKRQNEK